MERVFKHHVWERHQRWAPTVVGRIPPYRQKICHIDKMLRVMRWTRMGQSCRNQDGRDSPEKAQDLLGWRWLTTKAEQLCWFRGTNADGLVTNYQNRKRSSGRSQRRESTSKQLLKCRGHRNGCKVKCSKNKPSKAGTVKASWNPSANAVWSRCWHAWWECVSNSLSQQGNVVQYPATLKHSITKKLSIEWGWQSHISTSAHPSRHFPGVI